MSSDGALFVRRALSLLERLASEQPTTARWLAEQHEISLPTARRVIERLRLEYAIPLAFDHAEGTWYLEHDDWRFEPAQLADRAELFALAFALRLGEAVADPTLRRALDTLRQRITVLAGLDPSGLERMVAAFSADRTDATLLRDPVVHTVLEAIAQQRLLELDYQRPWQDAEPRHWTVRPLHLRQSDGALYLLATWRPERDIVFNLRFATRVDLGAPTRTPRGAQAEDEAERVARWRASFGVWSGDGVDTVEITLAPPDARYYAAQLWHPDQHDTFVGDCLVRTLPAHLSPELQRRLLSLGDGLVWVEPQPLRDAVRRKALALAARLDRPTSPVHQP